MTAKLGSELVYDLLNADNPDAPIPLSSANCTLGTPVVNTNDSIAKNTSLVLTAVLGQGYRSAQTVYYNRVALADLLATYPSEGGDTFSLADVVTYADLLPAFNTRYKVNLVAGDIVGGDLPDPVEGVISANFQAAPGSLILNGAVNLTIVFSVSPTLASAVTVTELSGFTAAMLQDIPVVPVDLSDVIPVTDLVGFTGLSQLGDTPPV